MTEHLNEVIPGLFIGDAFAAQSLQLLHAYQINACINVAKDLNDPWSPEIDAYKIGLIDGISHENCPELYRDAARLVLSLLARGRKVLLHCHEGKSRSVAIGMLVVAVLKKVSLEQALVEITSRRPVAFCKPGHYQYLPTALSQLTDV